MATHENESLLGRKPDVQHGSSSSEEWGEGSSYTSNSSYSASCSDDSYVANWEDYVCSDGTLFFAEYSFQDFPRIHPTTENPLNVMKNDFSRASTRRSAKKTNKLSRFMGKLEKKDETKLNQNSVGESSKVKFSEGNEGEIKEVIINLIPENRFKFGRRATASESLLGISTSPFPDGIRLMVAGYMANSEIMQEKSIKVGDWLKSINDIDINAQNLDETLGQFIRPTKIILKFQRILGEEQIVANANTIQQVTSFQSFSEFAEKLLSGPNEADKEIDTNLIFSLMILTLEYSDNDIESNDVLFCYPSKESNSLFPIRGSFLTLNSLLKSELQTETTSSNVTVNGIEYNVCYNSINKILLLFAISKRYASLKETKLRLSEVLQYIQFCHLTLNIPLNEYIQKDLNSICDILKVRLQQNKGNSCFEKILQESHLISLPKEAQLRIYDALSEMEAMDYRDWNDEPLNSHREFFITGSALYFKSYLLANHLPVSQLAGIESLLRCRGVFNFIDQQNVRDLVIWLEIPMQPSSSRSFLAIASRNQLLCAVILQSFDSERRLTENGTIEEKILGPSLFYIEEIQETLDHIRQGGIEALARTWITSNKRPEILTNLNNLQTQKLIQINKKTEVISILKNRSNSSDDVHVNSSMGGSSVHSLTHSEDSNQKLEDCDDSDSDWDGFPDSSHKSSSGFDMSEMKESFLKEISDIVPTRITSGKENVLFHYIHLDVGAGVILTPPEISINPLISSFRNACQLIHTVLQNTKKFRRLLSQESTRPNTHKSLVAIKEHGILLSVQNETGIETSFWVIGRLFTSPTRELYVCHRSDVPQNLVEIAFRLSFITAG